MDACGEHDGLQASLIRHCNYVLVFWHEYTSWLPYEIDGGDVRRSEKGGSAMSLFWNNSRFHQSLIYLKLYLHNATSTWQTLCEIVV